MSRCGEEKKNNKGLCTNPGIYEGKCGIHKKDKAVRSPVKKSDKKSDKKSKEVVFSPLIFLIDDDGVSLESYGVFRSKLHAINALIGGLVKNNFLSRDNFINELEGYLEDEDLKRPPIYNITEEEVKDEDKFILYLTNYVNGDFDKLLTLCDVGENGISNTYYKEGWNFRIDENIIEKNMFIKTSING
jgi:hypothetical protein